MCHEELIGSIQRSSGYTQFSIWRSSMSVIVTVSGISRLKRPYVWCPRHLRPTELDVNLHAESLGTPSPYLDGVPVSVTSFTGDFDIDHLRTTDTTGVMGHWYLGGHTLRWVFLGVRGLRSCVLDTTPDTDCFSTSNIRKPGTSELSIG